MGNPVLLLIDEPMEGLSPLIVQMLGEQITQLQKEGLTSLVVEQNADLILEISQRAYIMEKGKIRYQGLSKALREDKDTKKRYLGV